MRTTLGGKKLSLDDQAAKSIEAMMVSLREDGGPHLKLHPSKIASWVISCFQEKYFEKERGRMLEAHLDKKAALISLIERLDGTDEGARLDALLKLAKPRGERHAPPATEASNEEDT